MDVQSFAENRRVFHACRAKRCWIGLSDRARRRTLAWAGGTELGLVGRLGYEGFVKWAPSEPNYVAHDGPGNCVFIYGTKFESPSSRQAGTYVSCWCGRPSVAACS